MHLLITIILLLVCGIYVFIGFLSSRGVRKTEQFLPVDSGRTYVRNGKEFAASTVATSISMATVVLAIFELYPYLRLWLLWPVLTTAAGLILVRFCATRIWDRVCGDGGSIRLSLHDFLGKTYGTKSITLVAASATTLGFLGVLAVELTVASKFLSRFGPSAIPGFAWLLIIAAVLLVYVAAGGYRAVIVTDRIQMGTIVGFLVAGTLMVVALMTSKSGNDTAGTTLSGEGNRALFPVADGFTSFMIGILIINVPAALSDMSVWMRVAASENRKAVTDGLASSALGAAATWTWIVVLALCAFLLFGTPESEHPLFVLLNGTLNVGSTYADVLVLVAIVGLFGAALSTGSTQVMAAVHALYRDILGNLRPVGENNRLAGEEGLLGVRAALIVLLVFAVVVVEGLNRLGFSIADLVFAIYGAQLSLFPPVVLALFSRSKSLRSSALPALLAVIFGFVGGWASAIIGKIIGNADMVFLAPAVSLFGSVIVLFGGRILMSKKE
ncbi:MAG: hypothetical protein H7A48_14775 [Akkermansiaceae bacterium]|nr:hypothetical protein [Akkermansiaceae bacterium]